MVIRTEREPSEGRLVESLRRAFDSSVMNFGSYNILFAVNSQARTMAPGAEGTHCAEAPRAGRQHARPLSAEGICAFPHLLIGYRRTPAEFVLCPIDLDSALNHQPPPPDGEADRLRDASEAASPLRVRQQPVPPYPVSIDLTNLAGLATTGQQVQLTLSTGQFIALQIRAQWTFEQTPGVVLHQQRDIDDFYEFVDHFMDLMEGAQNPG